MATSKDQFVDRASDVMYIVYLIVNHGRNPDKNS